MSVLVTGATGLLGQAIAKSFVEEGAAIRVAGRNMEKLKAIYGAGCPAFVWDPAQSDFPQEALDGVQMVYHLMGEPVGGRWTKAKKVRFVTSRVTSAQKLAHALAGRPCRLVSASSFGIYPGRPGAVYDEKTTIASSASFIQSTIRACENAALLAANGAGRATVIRFGIVCAPNGYPRKLTRLFKRGLGFIAGDGEQIVPIVDIEDAVSMMRWTAERRVDGVINCGLPRFRDVAQTIAEAVERPIRLRIPERIARIVLGGSADYFLLSYDIRPARALAEGFSFRHTKPRAILNRALAPDGRVPEARPR